MLKKLLKYEYKATARSFAGLYVGLVCAAFLVGLSGLWTNALNVSGTNLTVDWDGTSASTMPENIAAITLFVYVGIVVAVLVVMFMMVVERFQKNLLTHEGYLMHTLPVSAWQLIASKVIMASFWAVVSGAMLFVSILVMGTLNGGFAWHSEWLTPLCSLLQMLPPLFIVLYILQAVAQWLVFLATVYLALMIAHQFQKIRFIAGVMAFFVLGSLQSAANTIFLQIANINSLALTAALSMVSVALFVRLLALLVVAAAYFYGVHYCMTKRLNLD